MMRFLVCSGMERAAGELFNAAETVPGVRPRCSAMVFRVTLGSERRDCFFPGGCVICKTLRHLRKLVYLRFPPHCGLRWLNLSHACHAYVSLTRLVSNARPASALTRGYAPGLPR